MSAPSTLLFAGGGTGGHVFPMIAVADAVRALAPDVRVVFVGTERGMERTLVPARGYELELVRVLPLRGGGAGGALRGAIRAARAVPEARALLARLDPRAVFSIGGYAAGPVALAARLSGRPVALMEPNAEIGLANRLIAPLVARAYTAFPESARYFSKRVVLETGVPIRSGFRPVPYAGGAPELRVLVFGGSQGARVLNEAVPRALSELGVALRVVHQSGGEREAETRAAYAAVGLGDRAEVVPFIDDMPRAIAASDLVIGRAGASTVSEIAAVGRASLLIPYPFAGDHQKHNARSWERQGAAVCVLSAEATPERLALEIRRLVGEPERLARMAEAARRLGRPLAADAIARDLLDLARLSPRPASAAASAAEPPRQGPSRLSAGARVLEVG